MVITESAVAARAGVAIGTVFRHFPAKPDLLSAVVMNAWEQLVAEVDSRLALLFEGLGTPPRGVHASL